MDLDFERALKEALSTLVEVPSSLRVLERPVPTCDLSNLPIELSSGDLDYLRACSYLLDLSS